eukprot:TRINITY_DN7312_c0_g1_i1.p1 TRINITY_DN7312_c0_g1~~TRINITY_DN7312_c0_g1_i1.p1  ORF type:complete len:493 (-),score=124.16 TRINITY_DN7312_c0_g1_i1:747-2138(-)
MDRNCSLLSGQLRLLLSFIFCSLFATISNAQLVPVEQVCRSISLGISQPNVCVNILQNTSSCTLYAQLVVNGAVLEQADFDMSLAPQVCTTYRVAVTTYTLCVQFTSPNATAMCAGLTAKAGPVTLPFPLGCFPVSSLANALQCRNSKCPSDCSGHGNCTAGICSCFMDYYGVQCNTTFPQTVQCVRVSELVGDLCVTLQFSSCTILFELSLGGLLLYTQSYDITDPSLRSVFQTTGICAEALGCSVCVRWPDLVLTPTQFSGCGQLSMSCAGLSYPPMEIGCFSNNDFIPNCFGACVQRSYCSLHGHCVQGRCVCNAGYNGPDCATTCPGDPVCGGPVRGSCTSSGTCQCNAGYQRDDCSVYTGGPAATDGADESAEAARAAEIAVPIVVVAIIAVAVVVLVVVRRRQAMNRKGPGSSLTLHLDDVAINSSGGGWLGVLVCVARVCAFVCAYVRLQNSAVYC